MLHACTCPDAVTSTSISMLHASTCRLFRVLIDYIFLYYLAPVIAQAHQSGTADNCVPHGPHTHYYPNHNRCHPKNVCHYCCYSDGEHWVFPWNKGPLRAAGVVIMWILLMIFCCPCALSFLIFIGMMSHVNFC